MLRFVFKRTLDAILTAFLVFSFVFFAMRLLPGDPVIAMLGDRASAETIANVRTSLGLDKPILVQYAEFLWGLVNFDLGQSLINRASVTETMMRNLPYTIALTIASTIVGVVIGVPLGVLSAVRAGKITDHITRIGSLVGSALPDFYLGVLFLMLFGLTLRWFPLLGGGDTALDLRYLVMPAMTLGLLKGFGMIRLTRTAVLDVAGRDYVRTAEALGMSRQNVIWRHIFRNALIPVATHLSLSIIATLGGTIAIELVFNRPGVGQLLVGAVTSRDYTLIQGGIVILSVLVVTINFLTERVTSRDYTLIQGGIVILSVLVVTINFLTDLLYAVIDPRVRTA